MTTLVWKTVALPPAVLGVPYEAGLAMALAGGGTLASLAVSAGALPPGITVSSTTDPRLIGTPTTAENSSWVNNQDGGGSAFAPNVFTFTLTATDGGGAVTKQYTITVFGSESDLRAQALDATPAAVLSQLHLA